ncbi:MAG: 4Fe-4S binding protein, partial [Bacteroidales bacterium]|nr:4Fe-4S binding protein [Bacteroidales bacterium]
MAKIKGAVVVDRERCKGCEVCVVTCPTETLALSPEVNGKGYHFSFAV